MEFVSGDMQMMHYIRSDTEFNRAKMKGFWQSLFDMLLQRPPRALSLGDVVGDVGSDRHIELGQQDVPTHQIVGSVSRSLDFTRNFLPASHDPVNRERWRKIYTLITLGKPMPPIEVCKVGQHYFVIDGHHRVSVARYLGWQTIQAHVTELQQVVA